VPIARDRCAKIDEKYSFSKTIVIGDTVRDIICAKAGGAKALVVETGGVSKEIFESHNPAPDHIVSTLENADAIIDLLISL
jgi:phosphoglycolate phosphatase-like HAD superfamily hydrolase